MHSPELDQLTQQQLNEEGVAGLGRRVGRFLFFVLALLLQWRNVWSASAVVIAYGIYDHYQGAASELLFRATGALVFLLAAYRLHKKESRAAADRESGLKEELVLLRTKREVDGRAREGLLNDIARLRADAGRTDALDSENRRLRENVDALSKEATGVSRLSAENASLSVAVKALDIENRSLEAEVGRLTAGPALRLQFDPEDRNCHGEGRRLSVKLVNDGGKASRASVILGALFVDDREVAIEPNQPFPLAHENTYVTDVSPGIPNYFVLFLNSDHAGNREQGLATWSLALRNARMPLVGHRLELHLRIQAETRAGGARLAFKQRADNPSFLGFDSLTQMDL